MAIDTADFYNCLLQNDIDFFAGVPDSLLQNLCACIRDKAPAQNNIITANEGNAIATAAGYHISGGKFGAVYMQNSGLGNAVNPLLSLVDADVYSIPMLLIIGWRGEPGVKDEPQHVTQGRLTLPLLDCMGIRYQILGENYREQVSECCEYMRKENKPVALVVQKGVFGKYAAEQPEDKFGMKREQALEAIIDTIEPDAFIVSTTGKTSREIFEIREHRGERHAHDFLTVGSMGHTASIAYGMSIGTDKNVYCIDGDGSFLMHMGSLGVIAQNAGANFKYILINNGAHESVGGQPTVGFDIDIAGVLRAVGFTHVAVADTPQSVREGVEDLKQQQYGALMIHTGQGSREDLGRPTVTPVQNKRDMMELFKAESTT